MNLATTNERNVKTSVSQEMHAKRRASIPGGVNSNIRLVAFPTPLTFDRAEGSHIWDVDGNEYIDYAMGMGPHILGHTPRPVIDAVRKSLEKGQLFAGQTEAEGDLAELLTSEIPWIEKVRFGLSGTEMDLLAVRLARAATGREKIIRFVGHYHGWLDPLFIPGSATESTPLELSPGQSKVLSQDLVLCAWNDLEALSRALTANDQQVAAVIMEPIMCNTGLIEPLPGFLRQVKTLCDHHGVVLIMDEVITGFRMGFKGEQERNGVYGDLTVYAKAIASGFPFAALGGRADLMDLIGGVGVNHSGTYNTGMVQTVAALATVRHLRESNPYDVIFDMGQKLRDGINALSKSRSVDLVCEGPGPMVQLRFGGDPSPFDARSFSERSNSARLSNLITELEANGVRLTSRGLMFLSVAHTDVDIAKTIQAFEKALDATS